MSHLKEVPDIADYPTMINEYALDIAEWLQDQVDSGNAQELLVVVGTEDDSYAVRFTPSLDCMRRLGMIEMVKADWLRTQCGD